MTASRAWSMALTLGLASFTLLPPTFAAVAPSEPLNVPRAAVASRSVAPAASGSADERVPEGTMRLRRSWPSMDIESLFDPNKPDFFLSIEIPPGGQELTAASPTPSPRPSAPAPTPAPTPAANVTPEASPIPSASLAPSAASTPESSPPTPASRLMATPSPAPFSLEPTPEPEARPHDLPGSLKRVYEAQRLAALGQYRKALGLVEGAISDEPDVASLHALRGSLLVKLRDYPEAQAAWERALQLDPETEDVKASLAWLRRHHGNGHD